MVSIKQVGEICAGPKIELLPGFGPDHFFKTGGTLEEQEECRGWQVGSVVDPQRPHVLQGVQPGQKDLVYIIWGEDLPPEQVREEASGDPAWEASV